MLPVEEIIARLKANAPSLHTRVEGAANLSELMRTNSLPQVTPAAHVIPLGLQGLTASAMTGAFVQELRETIGVVISIRSHDRSGKKALEGVEKILKEVISAIAGWAPEEEVGVFTVNRGGIVRMSNGTFVYQLDFSITDQLRILS